METILVKFEFFEKYSGTGVFYQFSNYFFMVASKNWIETYSLKW